MDIVDIEEFVELGSGNCTYMEASGSAMTLALALWQYLMASDLVLPSYHLQNKALEMRKEMFNENEYPLSKVENMDI